MIYTIEHNDSISELKAIVGVDGKRLLEMKRDPIMILQIIRFSIGSKCLIEELTFKEMIRHKELLNSIDKSKVTDEFRKIFELKESLHNQFIQCSEIILTIIPELRVCHNFSSRSRCHKHNVYEHLLYVLDGCETDSFEVKMAALLHDIGKPASFTEKETEDGKIRYKGHCHGHPEESYKICVKLLKERFEISEESYYNILNLVRFHDELVPTNIDEALRLIKKIGPDMLDKWMQLKRADIKDHIGMEYVLDKIDAFEEILETIKRRKI